MDTLLITAADVRRILDSQGRTEMMNRVIERLADGLRRSHTEQLPMSPPRGGFTRTDPVLGATEWMPHQGEDVITVKVVSYSPANPLRYELPTVLGTISRFDARTGGLVAVSDAVVLTAFRTGAASAIASRVLARPDSRTIGLLGTGLQAVTQLHALSLTFPVETVLAWDIRPEHLASFGSRTAFLGLSVEPAAPAEIAARADIIVTATSVGIGQGPVLPDADLAGHLHVNAVGSDLVGKTELPTSLLERALVVPDHPAQALAEGECQQLRPDQLGPSLAEVCAEPHRFAGERERLTVFDSTGFALEDHLTLAVFIDAAEALGIGTRVCLEHHPADPLDPYCEPAARKLAVR